MANVGLLAPQREGHPTSAALELATIARRLGDEVEAFAFGGGAAKAAAELGAHGVGRLSVVAVGDEVLPAPLVAAAIAARARERAYSRLLFPATYDGRDVAARLSAALDRPVLANAISLEAGAEGTVTEHALFGGTELARARLIGEGPGLYLVRGNPWRPLRAAERRRSSRSWRRAGSLMPCTSSPTTSRSAKDRRSRMRR